MKKNKFVIFSCGYNCEEYVELNILSIKSQSYKNYLHIIVDDASTDKTGKKLKKYKDKNLIIYRNNENQKWIKNSLLYFDKHIQQDDIVLTVDLDDWLAHNNVLSTLNNYYNNDNVWMTYSDFKYLKSERLSTWIPNYTEHIIKNKLFRKNIWSFKHLRTFRAFLWDKLDKNDLKDSNGEYFKYCYDQTIFLPMLEMSSNNHIIHIPDIQYIYNDMNPQQVEKIHRQEQEAIARYIRSKKNYNTL